MTRTSKPVAESASLVKARQRITQPVIHDGSEWQTLDLRLELQSMQTILTVLANVARLGCAISHLAANDNLVDLGLRAPNHVAHRVETCLAQIIGVRSVAAR